MIKFLILSSLFIASYGQQQSRLISERVWKLQLDGQQLDIVYPHPRAIPNRLYNFGFNHETICVIKRNEDGNLWMQLRNVFSLAGSHPIQLSSGMNQVNLEILICILNEI
jgi:hypothetical protein